MTRRALSWCCSPQSSVWGWGVASSEMFAIRTVRVICAQPESAGRAMERVQRITPGPSGCPHRAIERQIGGLPRAKAVTIGRTLPDTLTIEVEPRVPVAFVVADDRLMAVDDGASACTGPGPRRPTSRRCVSRTRPCSRWANGCARRTLCVCGRSAVAWPSATCWGASIDLEPPAEHLGLHRRRPAGQSWVTTSCSTRGAITGRTRGGPARARSQAVVHRPARASPDLQTHRVSSRPPAPRVGGVIAGSR